MLALEKSSTFWRFKHVYLMLRKLNYFHVPTVQRSQIEYIGINVAFDEIFEHLLVKHFHVDFFFLFFWGEVTTHTSIVAMCCITLHASDMNVV